MVCISVGRPGRSKCPCRRRCQLPSDVLGLILSLALAVVDRFSFIGAAALEAADEAAAARDRNGMSTLAIAGQSMDLVASLVQARRASSVSEWRWPQQQPRSDISGDTTGKDGNRSHLLLSLNNGSNLYHCLTARNRRCWVVVISTLPSDWTGEVDSSAGVLPVCLIAPEAPIECFRSATRYAFPRLRLRLRR